MPNDTIPKNPVLGVSSYVSGTSAKGNQILARAPLGTGGTVTPHHPPREDREDEKAYQAVVNCVTFRSPSGDDLFDAVDRLSRLDWSALWLTLERLAQSGPGLETMTYLELFHQRILALMKQADRESLVNDRLFAAIAAVLLRRGGRIIHVDDDLMHIESIARSLVRLSGVDQLEILEKLRITGESAEGAIAVMVAAATEVGMVQPKRALAHLGKGAFDFGDWDPPKNMEIFFYIGNQAHIQIAAFYKAAHMEHFVATNYIPVEAIAEELAKIQSFSVGKIGTALAVVKPDIFEFSLAHFPPALVYEIKPWSLVEPGALEAAMYVTALMRANIPVVLGPSNFPGTFGEVPAPNGYFVFESPVPGVIAYQYLQAPRAEILKRDARRGKKSSADALNPKALGIAGGLVGGAAILAAILVEVLSEVGWIFVF